jgi:hypothetical protein
MNKNLSVILQWILRVVVLGMALIPVFNARGQEVIIDSNVFANGSFVDVNQFATTPVIIQQRRPVLIIERRGSNDSFYQYDNVYGPEASAAGRMTRTVVNPQPQFFIRGF